MPNRKKEALGSGLIAGPWTLPDTLSWARMGELTELIRGVSYRKDQITQAAADLGMGVALLRGGNIQDGRIELDDLIFVDERCVSRDQRLRSGDIVCTMSSGSSHLVGKTALVTENLTDATFGAFCAALRPALGFSDWILLFTNTNTYRELLSNSAKGTNINNLKRDHILGIPIPMPPDDVRDGIVVRARELLEMVEDGEAALARARADLDVYRRSLLKAAVTGELTADWRAANPAQETGPALLARILADRRAIWSSQPNRSGREYSEPIELQAPDLPGLPAGWVWASFEQLSFVSGGVTKNAKRSELPLDLPYLRVANVGFGKVDTTSIAQIRVTYAEAQRTLLKAGDLLIVEGNGSVDQIGRSAVWEGEIERCSHQNHLIKARFVHPTLAAWAQVWLSSLLGRAELEQKASSTSGLHTLSLSKVESTRCPLPPLAEIEQIMERVASATHDADDLATKRDEMHMRTTQLRQSILAAAFRGQLV